MPAAEDVLLLSVEDSVERVSKLVKEELARLAALATASGSDAAQPDALAQRQRRLVADLGARLALAYREAAHALLQPRDAAEAAAAGKPLDGAGSGAVNGDAAPVTSDILSTLLQTEPASSGSHVSSSGSQTPPFANPADLVVVHPASPLAAGGSGASPAPVGSERLHSSRDHAAEAASSANTASGNSSGLIFTAPAAPDSNGPPRASHASSGWGSQYLPGVSSATLLAGVAGLAAQDSGAHNTNNQGSRSNPASGPLPQLPAHATAASTTAGGSASGLLSRLVANASAAAANGSPTLLRSVHAALGATAGAAGDEAAAAGSNSGLLPRVGAPGTSSGGLAQQQQADAEAELLRRLQEQQQARNNGMAAGSAPLPHVHANGNGGSALQQQHQQQQALLQQLLQQHQQEQQQQQAQHEQQQQQQAFTYQVDPATGNVVAVMAQDVYGNGGAQGQAQGQGGAGQALVLNDGTLVLDGSAPELLQQQYLAADPNFSNLFGAESGVASAGNTGPLPPVYLPSAQQQQQQRLAAAIAARGSELQQQQLDLQQQQQQLSAALLAAQQQQAQQQHSQQALSSLAALHAATGGANSEPLPMLVSIPNAQGGMTLALAAPGHGHHAGDHLQQLAGHHHALLPGGLTLAQAGTAASLLQQQQRLAGALSTPPSPLPGTAGGATLVAMPGGGLGALPGYHLGALGAGLSLGGLAAVQPLPASTAEMPGRFKVLPLLVQQRILTLCRTNPVITIRDFDDKVVSKLSLLVDSWGVEQALAMLDHLEYRMRTKQGAMKNGPGYLDVAVCSHLDMLKAQGACPKSMKLDEYAQQVLAPPVFHELCEAVNNNRWLAWEHFDQGIIQLLKRLPTESAVEKLQEITYHSFKNVDNVKGCIMSILNSKLREDRRRP